MSELAKMLSALFFGEYHEKSGYWLVTRCRFLELVELGLVARVTCVARALSGDSLVEVVASEDVRLRPGGPFPVIDGCDEEPQVDAAARVLFYEFVAKGRSGDYELWGYDGLDPKSRERFRNAARAVMKMGSTGS